MSITIGGNAITRWGNRPSSGFIDYMVQSASLLNRFSLVDGVKSRADIPVFNGTLVFGSDLCVFDPQSSTEISEKEMSVSTKKWDFLNCKSVLETSYRSKLLKKGQLNVETMDAEFKQWVFEYFAKLAAAEVMVQSATEIEAELVLDGDAIKAAHGLDLDETNILGEMLNGYKAMSQIMLSAIYGDADRAYKPAFFLGTIAYQAFEIAIANKFTTTPQGIVNGGVPTYFGMEVIHYSALSANTVMITSPSNLVMLTDNYSDVKAIQNKYEAELNSDKLWGQFKVGFSYYKGVEIIYRTKA
jgi:hypothetical protein